MIANRILERLPVSKLFGLLLGNRALRGQVLQLVERRMRHELVERNIYDRPPAVMESVCEYLSGLLYRLDRGLGEGLISPHVAERLTEVFLENTIIKREEWYNAEPDAYKQQKPLFVLVSPTGRCNLNCIGCYSDSGAAHQNQLSADTFDRILREKREFWNSYFTVISGGEPFMWREGDTGLLDIIERHPEQFFMVYTNSTLITDETARRMADLGNISPCVSVEGFEAETDHRRGKGVHAKVLRAFERFRRHGIPFGVSMTPTRENWRTIVSDDFIDVYFEREGAMYGWLFQYMPVGRGQTLDLVVPPEERVQMMERMHRVIRERKVFLADFWNSGHVSCGCVSAGREGGYFYIDWNGDVTPCVFVPYAAANINRIYADGGDLNDALEAPFFRKIRAWQNDYGYIQPGQKVRNWFTPCISRDHHEVLREAIAETNPKPINGEAKAALEDRDYIEGMKAYGRRIRELTGPIWRERMATRAAGADAEADSEQTPARGEPTAPPVYHEAGN